MSRNARNLGLLGIFMVAISVSVWAIPAANRFNVSQLSSVPVNGADFTISQVYNFGRMGNALAVNGAGHVTGAIYGVLSSEQGYTDYFWLNPSAEPTPVQPCCGQANDVNDFDDVVGYTPQYAYIWREAEGLQTLGALPGHSSSEAFGVNNDGFVVGDSGPNRNHAQAVLFAPSAPRSLTYTAINLGAMTGLTYSIAWDINDAGQIVGEGTDTSTGTTYALLWQPTPSGYDVIVLDSTGIGGPESGASAHRLSGRGEVAGTVLLTDGSTRGFVWSPAAENLPTGTMVDVGPGRADGINNLGIAVGTGDDGRPFVWSLASGRSQLPFYQVGAEAYDINDDGTIAGWFIATNNQSYPMIWQLPTPPDTEPPVVSCGTADGHWHAADASIACTASDSGSGLLNASDASFLVSTSVASGTETSNASTSSHTVCDNASNCATVSPIGGNMVDKRPPSISITTPEARTYLLNQVVPSNFGCVDGGSGVITCTGPVANAAQIMTGIVGARTFAVNASDQVGNEAHASVSYTVGYNTCLLFDATKSYKTGSTIPIKIQLCDAAGNNASNAAIPVVATAVHLVSTSAPGPLADSGNANPDNQFRFSSGGYIFNLSLKGFSEGTYELVFTAGADPTTHVVYFQVK